jgi:hypothetical protein
LQVKQKHRRRLLTLLYYCDKVVTDETGAKDAPTMVDLEQAARSYVGDGGLPGDAWNNFFVAQLHLDDEWPKKIKPIETYAGYIRKIKCEHNQPMADAIIKATDPSLVAQHDKIVEQINKIIGDGVKTQQQVDAIQGLLDEARTLIYG